jgi:biotin carboxyl carrier protein
MAQTSIYSEINGSVWKIVVTEGDKVAEDDTLAIVESMKMEIPVLATCAGVVGKILVVKGQPIKEGESIMTISH